MPQKLGQHFLNNPAAIKKILAALNIQTEDTLIEIGPGRGALTASLLNECQKDGAQLVAIERDPILATKLGENFQLPIANFQIITGDALKFLPTLIVDWKLKIGHWKLVGNIPYYITGSLLRLLGEINPRPSKVVLMLQKEVAERLAAKSPKMNLLSASVQIFYQPKILFTLKPQEFIPPPKVSSGVIELTPRAIDPGFDREKYFTAVHFLFKQPRKTLVNNLYASKLFVDKNQVISLLAGLGLSQSSRPQDLTLDQIQKLARLIPTTSVL